MTIDRRMLFSLPKRGSNRIIFLNLIKKGVYLEIRALLEEKDSFNALIFFVLFYSFFFFGGGTNVFLISLHVAFVSFSNHSARSHYLFRSSSMSKI